MNAHLISPEDPGFCLIALCICREYHPRNHRGALALRRIPRNFPFSLRLERRNGIYFVPRQTVAEVFVFFA